MAFKQPRVPEYRESEGTGKYLRSLVLFLKDFCNDVWTANNQRAGEIGAVKAGYPVTSVCGKTGDVALDAGDVGALPSGGTAADSSKLGGVAASDYALKTYKAPDSSKLEGKTLATIKKEIYPVGAIYMSVSSTSPASLFGGTWEQLKDRFLLGAGGGYAAGGTGGAATVALEANQLPKITGYIEAGAGSSGSATSSGHGAFRSASGIFTTSRQCHYSYSHGSDTWTSTDTDAWQQVNMSFGNNEAHNNMPPYLAVYMWKRVS